MNAMASKKAGDTVEIKYFRMEGDELEELGKL